MVTRPSSRILWTLSRALAAGAFIAAAALAQAAEKPVLYNNLEGDGGVTLDRAIKDAFAAKYTIVDTSRAAGYAEPDATAGDLPKTATDEQGQYLAGYVLVAYIVTADGLVAEPVVLKSNDERLSKVALDAMAHWRFTPGKLNGVAVATTAAQEFNFGPVDVSNGYRLDRIVVYQPNDILVQRMPSSDVVKAYIYDLKQVAHNFFVGDSTPEIFHIVVVVRPGFRARVWFESSARPGDSKELEPLRKLLEAVRPMPVRGGPVIMGLTASIAGGDHKDHSKDAYPVPSEWREIARSMKTPAPISSDAFLDAAWPDAR
jgi:hypothetical protein